MQKYVKIIVTITIISVLLMSCKIDIEQEYPNAEEKQGEVSTQEPFVFDPKQGDINDDLPLDNWEYPFGEINATKEYSLPEKFRAIVEIDGLLYFMREKQLGDRLLHQVCSVRENGKSLTVLYEFVHNGYARFGMDIMKINTDNILFMQNRNPIILNLKTKEIAVHNFNHEENTGDMVFRFYDDLFYCYRSYYDISNYYSEYSTSLFVVDMNFENERLLVEDIVFFEIYKNKVIFQTSSLKSQSNLFMCDLDGSNVEQTGDIYVQANGFSIYNDVVYSYDNNGTMTIDLLTGESKVISPRITYFDVQFIQDFFITTKLFGQNVYKISYDWENVEVIAEYYCVPVVIGDYVYLTPYIGDAYEVDKDLIIQDAIYRVRLDKSGFERFVTVHE